MKKYVFTAMVLVCILFVAGCKSSPDEEHNDPSFLVGTWANSNATFTIAGDFTFVCDMLMPGATGNIPARAYGRLDYTSSGLGANDYFLREMRGATAGDPDSTYTEGNASLSGMIGPFNDIIATLKPNASKNQFTFRSTVVLAEAFFGGSGPYNKK